MRLDTATYTGTLSFSAEEDPGRVNGSADVAIVTVDGDTACRRRIAGDLHIRIPLVGGTAEKKVVPGLVRRLDVEAAALSQELRDARLTRGRERRARAARAGPGRRRRQERKAGRGIYATTRR